MLKCKVKELFNKVIGHDHGDTYKDFKVGSTAPLNVEYNKGKQNWIVDPKVAFNEYKEEDDCPLCRFAGRDEEQWRAYGCPSTCTCTEEQIKLKRKN